MIDYQYNMSPPEPPRRKKFVLIGVIAAAVIIAVGLALWRPWQKDPGPTPTPQPAAALEPAAEEPKPTPKPKAAFNADALNDTLKKWVSSRGGTYGVTLADDTGKVLATSNGDEKFFAASIYKLYVAYIGYQRIDDGTYNLSDPYLNGWTRGKCLDEMLRTSHSPCAEKMWVELGKENLTEALKVYGLKDTSMTGLTTSSRDAAIILARLQQGKDLARASRKAMLGSMKEQIYRDALPIGFIKETVYDKVGFREQVEYHDVAIVEFEDGRRLIVSVLTKNVGTSNIAALARAIKTAALKN